MVLVLLVYGLNNLTMYGPEQVHALLNSLYKHSNTRKQQFRKEFLVTLCWKIIFYICELQHNVQ